MKTIALCMNIEDLCTDFENNEVCKKYPGAGFLPHLAKIARAEGVTLLSGKEVLQKIQEKKIDPKKVLIFQEELNPVGFELLRKGCIPQLVFCLESKMYAPVFYDLLSEIKPIFKNHLLFQGGTRPLYFPSYDDEDLVLSGEHSKEICMITSNKQWWSLFPYWKSPSWCFSIRNELHTQRLRAIEAHPEMDLFGYGWDNLNNLPPQWAFLKPQIEKMWKGITPNKIKTLSQYKRAICYENTKEPGYITEKLPHCYVAGTHPVYSDIPDSFELKNYSNQAFAKTTLELLL